MLIPNTADFVVGPHGKAFEYFRLRALCILVSFFFFFQCANEVNQKQGGLSMGSEVLIMGHFQEVYVCLLCSDLSSSYESSIWNHLEQWNGPSVKTPLDNHDFSSAFSFFSLSGLVEIPIKTQVFWNGPHCETRYMFSCRATFKVKIIIRYKHAYIDNTMNFNSGETNSSATWHGNESAHIEQLNSQRRW